MITPNIIVTKRFDTMRRIFFGPASLGDTRFNSLGIALEEAKFLGGEDDLICAPGSNSSLIEADLNIPPGGGVTKGYLNLKFVETREVLEYFLLDLSPVESNFNIIYNLFDKAKIPLDDTLKKINRFYIAFGSGDNLNEWAGPFEVSLGSASVNLDNNVKTITLGFIMGELGSIRSYNQKLYGNLGFGTADKMNSVLPKDSKVSCKALLHLNQGLDPVKGPLENPARIGRRRCLLPPRGWNSYVRDLIRLYLGKVYGDPFRVLVLLPDDLDKVLNEGLAKASAAVDFLRNYQGRLKEFGIRLRLRNPSAENTNQPVASDSSEFSAGKQATNVTVGFGYNEGTTQSFTPGIGIDSETGEQTPIDGRFNTAEQFGAGVTSRLKGRAFATRVRDAYKEFTTWNETQGISQAQREKITEYMKLFDSSTRAFLLTECYLIMEASVNVPDTGQSQPPKTLLDPIFEFIGALKKHTGKPTEYVLYELNDIEINEMINENCSFPLLKKRSRLIFGDSDIVKRLIYLADDGKKPLNQSSYKFTFADANLDSINWEDYQKQFRNTILKRERAQTSSFKEKLDFGPFNPEFKEIENTKDIIFLHGVKNSNVQSVSFNKDFAQGELFNFSLSARRKSPLLNNFLRLAVANDNFKINEIIDYLEDYDIFEDDFNASKFNLVNFIKDLEKGAGADLAGADRLSQFKFLLETSDSRILSQGLKGKPQEFLDFIDLIVGYRNVLRAIQEDGLDAEVAYFNDGESDSNRILRTYADLLVKAQKLIQTIRVKTVPFFNQKNYFERKSYFFSLYNNIISRSDETTKIPSTLLNGSYLITGARHYLSSEDAFSEFTLVKDNLTDDPIIESTRKALGEAASVTDEDQAGIDAVMFGDDDAGDPKVTDSADATRLPKDGKRQEIAKTLQNRNATKLLKANIELVTQGMREDPPISYRSDFERFLKNGGEAYRNAFLQLLRFYDDPTPFPPSQPGEPPPLDRYIFRLTETEFVSLMNGIQTIPEFKSL